MFIGRHLSNVFSIRVSILLFVIFLSSGTIPSIHAQTPSQETLKTQSVSSQGTRLNGASAQSSLASKKILILHSYGYALPANMIFDQRLKELFLANGIDVNNLFFEFMDVPRNPGQEYRNRLSEFLRNKYREGKFDLVITVGHEAIQFLINEGRDLYPEGPIISALGSVDIQHSDPKRPLIRLVFSIDIIANVQAMVNLQPDTRRILVIAGSSTSDRRNEGIVRTKLGEWKGAPDVDFMEPLPLDEILKKIANLPDKTAILFVSFLADSTGKAYISRDVCRMISRSANAPVFGGYDTLFGDDGIVGGVMLSYRLEGERTVRSALDILQGNLPSQPLTIQPAPLTPMFDWQQIKRWNLDEGRLPPKSIIINRPISLWTQYKGYIIGSLIVFIVLVSLLVAMLLQKHRKVLALIALGKAQEKYKIIFDTALEGIFETSVRGEPLTVNPAMARMLGYDSPADVMVSIKDAENQVWANPRERANYIRLLEEQKVVLGFECQFLHKDGTRFWVSLNAQQVSGSDEKTPFYSGFVEDITQRKLAEQAMEERLQFETLLADLSVRFVNLPGEQLVTEIEHALRRICECLDIDVSTLWRVSSDKPDAICLTNYYLRPDLMPGFPPIPEAIDLKDASPWCLEKLVKGEDIVIPRLLDAPPEAARDLELWQHFGIKSVLSLPLSTWSSPMFGVLNFDTIQEERQWSPELIKRLQIVAQIFANTIARIRADELLRTSKEALTSSQKDLQRLAGKLITSQEEELRRLSRELHDDLTQRLAVLAIEAGKLELDLNNVPQSLTSQVRTVGQIKDQLIKVSEDIHSISRQLHPTILDDLGLVRAIESECAMLLSRKGLRIRFDKQNIPDTISKEVALGVYRIVQEGLKNIIKHSGAESADIFLKGGDNSICLTMKDSGIGFDPSQVRHKPGMGLASMRERAFLVHGDFSIESRPGQGTVIKFVVPLKGGGV